MFLFQVRSSRWNWLLSSSDLGSKDKYNCWRLHWIHWWWDFCWNCPSCCCSCRIVLKLLLLFSHWVVSDSFATPWTVARQAPLSMRFFRQEYWSELPCPPPEIPIFWYVISAYVCLYHFTTQKFYLTCTLNWEQSNILLCLLYFSFKLCSSLLW